MGYVRRAEYAEEIYQSDLILILALSTTHTAYATSVSDLQKQRQEKENEKKGTQGQLDSLNDQINDLSGEKRM